MLNLIDFIYSCGAGVFFGYNCTFRRRGVILKCKGTRAHEQY